MTEEEERHETCPGPNCVVEGAAVYVADKHPTTCRWMMRVARRCTVHDELLRPDEPRCPTPDVPEEQEDPHNRLGG